MNFDLNSAIYLNGYWIDDNGNRITESEYFKILSASTWSEIDPEDILDDNGYTKTEIESIRAEFPFEEDFREYVMGINL